LSTFFAGLASWLRVDGVFGSLFVLGAVLSLAAGFGCGSGCATGALSSSMLSNGVGAA
jgi:hypothetical protein